MSDALGQPPELPETLVLPLLRSSARTERMVRRALGRPPGLSVRAIASVGAWAELVASSGVGLLDVAMLGQEEVVQALGQLRDLGIRPPRIVGVAASTDAAVERRDELAQWELTAVVLSPERATLGVAVAQAWIASIGARLRALLGEVRFGHSDIDWSLRHLTREMVPGPDAADARPPLRRIEELVANIKTSRATFHRARRAAHLDVRGLAEVWVATQAACIKAIENPTLKALARRVGYRGPSGLTALGERALGIPAGKWRKTPLSELISICMDAWSEALRNASPGTDPDDRSKEKRRGATS